MYEIGLSTTGKDINDKLFEAYSMYGMKYMEVSTDYEMYNNHNWRDFKSKADNHGINIWSFHLPFKPFEIIDMSSSDKEKRQFSVEYYRELIKKIAYIGVDKFVLHSGGKVTRKSDTEVEERIKYARESYANLAEAAEHEGAVIAVENLPPVCVGATIDEVKQLISADSRLRICFDTNHLLCDDPCEFIRSFGDKIITVHISDYDRINERHWLPGEGVNDWYSIYDTLREVNYKGIWLYEVAFCQLPTIKRDRDLTCQDFINNAGEIFNRKPITVLGKPNII